MGINPVGLLLFSFEGSSGFRRGVTLPCPLPYFVSVKFFFDLYKWNWKAEGTNAKLTGRNSSPQARNYTVFCPLSSDFRLGL